MKENFINQLTEEMLLLEMLLEESNDEAQEQSIIKMLVELTKYINKIVNY